MYVVHPPNSNSHVLTRSTSLATVNFFLGVVGITQVTRILLWRNSQKGSIAETVEDVKEEVKQDVKEIVKA